MAVGVDSLNSHLFLFSFSSQGSLSL